jgi:hypothetical protein
MFEKVEEFERSCRVGEKMWPLIKVSPELFGKFVQTWYHDDLRIVYLTMYLAATGATFVEVDCMAIGLFDMRAGEKNLAKRIRDYLKVVADAPLWKTAHEVMLRTQLEMRFLPRCTMLIDTFPVHVRGPSSAFHGKYHKKVRKYQAVTNLKGDLLSVQPCTGSRAVGDKVETVTGTTHDLKVFKILGLPFPTREWELLIGDKAYGGATQVVTAFKNPKGATVAKQKRRINKFLQIVRSPVERCFARLHRFRTLRFSRFSPRVTDDLVCLVANIEILRAGQPASEFVAERKTQEPEYLGPPAPPKKKKNKKREEPLPVRDEGRLEVIPASAVRDRMLRFDLSPDVIRLVGKNSTKRGKAAPEFKKAEDGLMTESDRESGDSKGDSESDGDSDNGSRKRPREDSTDYDTLSSWSGLESSYSDDEGYLWSESSDSSDD